MPIIQSVERALRILDLFDEHATELKITDISTMMGLHKSTLHSLLKTLQVQGYIDQNPDNGKYRLGLKLVERGNFVVNSMDIRQQAKNHLLDLSIKTGQTTHLAILDGREGVYIDKVEGKMAIISYSRIGRRLPVHATAIGKVLLAFLTKEQMAGILRDYNYSVQTPHTLTSESQLLDALVGVRDKGYAIDREENEQGVQCVAVPIRNHNGEVIAALSISTLTSRVDERQLRDYIALLTQAGRELSEKLGYASPS
ncbi:IclR family transcriptional regulator [Affinibrenneria salicis]|uniref:IclR family transcriptional regulator n=1 Tax=Affinibrenneria salicis TaxID=2590031 RepID=A0A5J5FUJ3_9GAMM|nr:IclR family transcriptional regulator [Affinibrenneria salicis]KAA8997032.1 IclR family transcriptional regulator [Affinibrenneria salicis]